MMKRFGIVNEILKLSKNRQFKPPQFINIYPNTKFHFTSTNSGVKSIDLIKILRAETSKKIFINYSNI